MQTFSIKNLNDAFKKMKFKKNNSYIIHSSLTHLGLLKGKPIEQIPKNIFNVLIKNLGRDSTISVPTSDWNYSQKKTLFDKKSSVAHKDFGGLSQYFVKRKRSFRSNNPLFNITAIGKKAKYITGGNTNNAFGKDSAWDRLYNLNSEILLLGCDFSETNFTFTRYIEFRFGVPYLYNKLFQQPINQNKKKIFDFSISTLRYHDLDIQYDLKNFKKILKKRKILVENTDKKIKITRVKMKPCFDLGIECLKKDINFFLKKKPKYKNKLYPLI